MTDDQLMEQILANLKNTPLGKVLKNIADLPEMRQQKILGVRSKITQGNYDLSDRIDIVIDRVLEDLTVEIK